MAPLERALVVSFAAGDREAFIIVNRKNLRPSLFADQQGRVTVSQRAQQVVMTRQSSDGQVAMALNDLGWTVFGGKAGQPLEGTIAKGQFILEPMQATTVSSVDIKKETGTEFVQLLSKSHNVLPCLP